MHAVGRSLPDLFRLRRGEIETVPEAVMVPAEEGAVAVPCIAAEANPSCSGGGSSVVAAEAYRAGQGALADTTRLDRSPRLDPESRTATFQAGIDAAPPRSRSTATRSATSRSRAFDAGGWIATRPSVSNDGYGGIDELQRGRTLAGVIRTPDAARREWSGANQLRRPEGVLGDRRSHRADPPTAAPGRAWHVVRSSDAPPQ
jgi:alkyldihydroxyacetonephosphate synthase